MFKQNRRSALGRKPTPCRIKPRHPGEHQMGGGGLHRNVMAVVDHQDAHRGKGRPECLRGDHNTVEQLAPLPLPGRNRRANRQVWQGGGVFHIQPDIFSGSLLIQPRGNLGWRGRIAIGKDQHAGSFQSLLNSSFGPVDAGAGNPVLQEHPVEIVICAAHQNEWRLRGREARRASQAADAQGNQDEEWSDSPVHRHFFIPIPAGTQTRSLSNSR